MSSSSLFVIFLSGLSHHCSFGLHGQSGLDCVAIDRCVCDSQGIHRKLCFLSCHVQYVIIVPFIFRLHSSQRTTCCSR